MTIRHALVLALFGTLLPVSAAICADAQPAATAKDMLLEQAAKVGPQQEALASALVGEWSVVVSLYPDPEHPVVEKGRAVFTRVLGGRHVRQDLRFSSNEQPFEGLGFLGYDNVTGRYFSSWMDTSFTGAMLAQGDYDRVSRTYTFHGSQADPLKEAGLIPVREVLHLTDADAFTYEYYEVHHGQEKLAVSLAYQRLR